MTSASLIFCSYFLFGSMIAKAADDRIGFIYPLGKTDSTPLFTQKSHYSKNKEGFVTVTSSIFDSKSNLTLSETAVFRGSVLVSQSVEQFQTGHQYSVLPKGEQIFFKDVDLNSKKIEEAHVAATDDFITGPTTQPFLVEHWKELIDGKVIHCRFGVLESKDTFGFDFKLKRKEIIHHQELLVIGMKPSSFFNGLAFSLLDDGIEIYIDPVTKLYKRYKGLTPVQMKDEKGKLHRFTAEIIYE